MILKFDKTFSEFSGNNDYNKCFIRTIAKIFIKKYEKGERITFLDLLSKLGCDVNSTFYDKENVEWFKGKIEVPIFNIKGLTMEII